MNPRRLGRLGQLRASAESARPTARLRLGPQQFGDELKQKLGKAFNQINKSAKLIEDRHPAFAHIPHDRPRFGIVVTVEPYHLVNSPDFRVLLPDTEVPTAIASASELEDVVVAADTGLQEGIVSRLGQPRRADGSYGISPADGWSSTRSSTRGGRRTRGAPSTPPPPAAARRR